MRRHSTIITILVILLLSGCTMFIRDPEKAYSKGIELIQKKKPEEAYQFFLVATKKQPDNPKYHWAAAQTAQNQNAAFIHTEMAWKSGMKTVPVMGALLRLSVFSSKQQQIERMISLFGELPDSIKTPMLKAELFSQFGASDSAIAIWEKQYATNPTSFLAFKIGRELGVKNDLSASREFLETARKAKILDGAGYVLLASMRGYEYDYEGVSDIFQETRKLGLYSDEVAMEEASFFYVSGKYSEATAILSGYHTPNKDQKDQLINHRARMNLAIMYASQKHMDSIDVMSSEIPDLSSFKNMELKFYSILKQGDKMEPASVLKTLDTIRKNLPPNPFIELVSARALLKNGDAAKAVELYRRLPGIYLRSPAILTEYAMALTRSGKDTDALFVLSSMHKQHYFTKASLELFRDLTFKQNLIDKSENAQKLLEKLYGNDARIRWNGATLALRAGKVDSALILLTDLEKQFPNEYQFRTAHISALIVKGDYDNALKLCHSGNIPHEMVLPLETQILRKQGKDADALQLIKTAVKEKSTPQLQLLHAEMLMVMNKNGEAAKIYESLLDSRKSDQKEDPTTAALYNNMAWAQLQTENPDKKVTLKAAEHAFELLPTSPNIVDTYAEALIKFAEYDKCIKLLENFKNTAQEPRLTFQLGIAFEKKNDLNKAIRNYQTAIALMDSSSGTLKMDISKASVANHIEKLMNNN